MDIIILAVVDGSNEQHDVISFPDPILGMQAFGIIQQIARNRQQQAIDEFTKEAVAMSGMRLASHILDGGEQ